MRITGKQTCDPYPPQSKRVERVAPVKLFVILDFYTFLHDELLNFSRIAYKRWKLLLGCYTRQVAIHVHYISYILLLVFGENRA